MSESGGARSPTREATDPLWAQILADLRRRLSEGEFRHVSPANSRWSTSTASAGTPSASRCAGCAASAWSPPT
jgi:hypothetical protein